MIISVVVIVALAIAAIIVLSADGRPSLVRTLCGIPFAVVALSTPFLFEQGCNDPDSDSKRQTHVVTRDASGVLTAHSGIAWCPKRCVNVPGKIIAWLGLPNGITFRANFVVKDRVALVRALKLDEVDRIVETEEVDNAAQAALGPLLSGFITKHQEALLRRPLLQQQALDDTHQEFILYLKGPLPGDPPPARPEALGLEFSDLCCAQMAGARAAGE